jgi:hypothetical protein
VFANCEYVLNILRSLSNISLDIHCETRSLGDGKTEVKSDNSGDASKTDEQTPGMINRESGREWTSEDGLLVCRNNDESNKGSS